MIAMLFILFDIEVVFLYPVGVLVNAADSVFVLVEILVFVACCWSRWSSSGAGERSIGSRAAKLRSHRSSSPLAEELRVRQLRARDLLRGDLEGAELEEHVEERVLTTTLEKALDWARANSIFPCTFGLACCAIEMMSMVTLALRHRPLRRRGLPRLAAPGGHADPLGPGLDQDGAGRPPHLRPDAGAQVGDRDGRLLVAPAACSPTTRSSRAPTSSCRSTSTSPAARRGPRRCCTASTSCSGMIQGQPDLGWRQRYNAIGTEEWARAEQGPSARRDGRRARERDRRPTGASRERLMPDAPGLELIAQELERRPPGSGPRTSLEHGHGRR